MPSFHINRLIAHGRQDCDATGPAVQSSLRRCTEGRLVCCPCSSHTHMRTDMNWCHTMLACC